MSSPADPQKSYLVPKSSPPSWSDTAFNISERYSVSSESMLPALDRAFRCCQRNSDIATLETLIPGSVNPNATMPTARLRSLTRRNVPLLCVASACGSLDAVRVLVRAGALLDAVDSSGWSAIDWAAFAGQAPVLAFLIENGGKPQVTQRGGPLLQATRHGQLECVNCLINAGAPVTTTDIAGRTPLHLACWFSHTEVAKALIAAGAPVDAQDPQLRTPLHYCAWFGNSEIIPMLLERRVPLNAGDKAHDTPLHFACKHSRKEVVSALLRAGADTKATNADGRTPEDFAEAEDNREILELLQKRETPPPVVPGLDGPVNAILKEQKEMNRTLEAITGIQEAQVARVANLKATVDMQWAHLQDLANGHGALDNELHELEEIAIQVRDTLVARERRRSAGRSAGKRVTSDPSRFA
jgi:ankyrin repeat protein